MENKNNKILMPLFLCLFFSISCVANSCAKKVTLSSSIKNGYNDPNFGNFSPICTVEEFNRYFSYGDIINVNIFSKDGKGDINRDMPYVTNYNETGHYSCRIVDYEMAGNNIDLCFDCLKDRFNGDNYFGQSVIFTLVKKGGYNEIIDLLKLQTKNSFNDVNNDRKIFTNFRDLTEIGSLSNVIKPGMIYRSGSPFDKSSNAERYKYTDELLEYFDIQYEVVLGMDTEKMNSKFSKLDENECSNVKNLYKNELVKPFNVGNDFFTVNPDGTGGGTTIRDAFNEISNFFQKSNGTGGLLVNCAEGKDRTGFMCFLIEGLVHYEENGIAYSADINDIKADFMMTYKNYYNVSLADSITRYDKILELTLLRYWYSILIENPYDTFSSIDWDTFDIVNAITNKLLIKPLYSYVEEYLIRIGVDKTNIDRFIECVRP